MLAQLLVMMVALGLTYGLLRLRHSILACGKDKRKCYRAYIIGFEQTDDRFGQDDNLGRNPSTDEALSEWPTELEIPLGAPTHTQEKADVYDTEAAGISAITLPKK